MSTPQPPGPGLPEHAPSVQISIVSAMRVRSACLHAASRLAIECVHGAQRSSDCRAGRGDCRFPAALAGIAQRGAARRVAGNSCGRCALCRHRGGGTGGRAAAGAGCRRWGSSWRWLRRRRRVAGLPMSRRSISVGRAGNRRWRSWMGARQWRRSARAEAVGRSTRRCAQLALCVARTMNSTRWDWASGGR